MVSESNITIKIIYFIHSGSYFLHEIKWATMINYCLFFEDAICIILYYEKFVDLWWGLLKHFGERALLNKLINNDNNNKSNFFCTLHDV
jgi:hypothetical protein